MIAAKDILDRTVLKLDTSAEFCAARFDCSGKKSLTKGFLYRQPSSEYLYMGEITEAISKHHHCNPESTQWIAGDANLPDINWALMPL